MKEKNSIRRKITMTVFAVAIIARIVLGCATIINISVMRRQILETDQRLGETASEDSAIALEQETVSRMLTISSYLGQLADEKLGGIAEHATMLANIATSIFSNPEAYSPMQIEQARDEDAGTVTLHYAKPRSVPVEQVEQRARLAANAGDFMRQMLAVEESVLTCYISFNDGLHVVCDADSGLRTAEDYDYDPSTRAWFIQAQQRGGAGFTDITVDARGRGLGVVCSAPFYGEGGETLGAVGIGVLIDEIDQLILTADLGTTGQAFVLNATGEMVIGEDVQLSEDGTGFVRPDVAGSSTQLADLNMTSGGHGVEMVSYQGRDVYMAWYPIESANWTLVITVDVDEALTLARQTSERIGAMSENAMQSVDTSIVISIIIVIVVSLVTAACVVMVGMRRARAITQPLNRLTQSVGLISGGDLTHHIDIRTGDEIETLADSFNNMTVQLNDYIRNLTAVTAEKERIGAELDVARQIQASMLPCIFPAFPDRKEFDIYATMTPAKEVGGDFYDFFLVDDDHLAIVIADVSGKGVPAALFMVIAKTLIKNNSQAGNAPNDTFTTVNAQLCENNEAGMFVTCWMGIYTISTGKLIYANAGHNPPLIMRAGGQYEYLHSRPGFVLAGMEGIRYKINETELMPGEMLYLYTDGVTEATNSRLELYGEPRLQKVLNANRDAGPMSLLPIVKADIDEFAGDAPQFDDITMVCLQIREKPQNIMTVAADDANLDKVLEFVDSMMERGGFSAGDRQKVAIAAEELFVNVAHYAYPNGGGEVTICCRLCANGAIEVSFQDHGAPYNPLGKPDPDITLSAEERSIGGLGIFMTKKLMDDVRYVWKNGENITTIVKNAKKT
ncbi:MAG: SpoIIE family protein phosphatase [Clostridia bacterium]|nr:SpoIIE family protein phosphatase [Clostridia bacterium]